MNSKTCAPSQGSVGERRQRLWQQIRQRKISHQLILGQRLLDIADTYKAFLLLAVCVIATKSASALTFMDGKCEYTADELRNPDAVVELTLSGKKFCRGFFLDQKLYQEIELPHFGRYSPLYPESSIRGLLQKYGLPATTFEPWGGFYREYKVRDKRRFLPIDGYESIEYTVEVLYVYLEGWRQVPNSGRYGLVPVCERSVVKLYAIKTADGWYVAKPGPGDSLGRSVERQIQLMMDRDWAKDRIASEIAEIRTVAAQCNDSLNR